jgi:hypothetical protein
LPCAADKLRDFCACRRIIRHQAQESLRSHSDPDSAQAREEKIDGGEIAHAKADRNAGEIPDAETNGNAGEIAVIEEKERRDSHSVRETVSECLCVREKEEILAQPLSRVFAERVEQEKETQNFTDVDFIPCRIAGAFGNLERNP